MSSQKKKDTTYQVALFGAKGVVRLLLYVLILIVIIWLGRTAYVFGYSIFNEQAMASSPGEDVTVTIPKDSTPHEIGEILKKNGLISDVNIFVVQERLSGYHNKLVPGTYTLNTSQTASKMLTILAGDTSSDTSGNTTNSTGNTVGNSAKGTNSTGTASGGASTGTSAGTVSSGTSSAAASSDASKGNAS